MEGQGRDHVSLSAFSLLLHLHPIPAGRREHIPESEFSQGVWMGPGQERAPCLRTNRHLPCSLGFCSDPWLQGKLASLLVPLFWPYFLSSALRESLPQKALPRVTLGPGLVLSRPQAPICETWALCNASSNFAALHFISPSPPQEVVLSPLFYKGERGFSFDACPKSCR